MTDQPSAGGSLASGFNGLLDAQAFHPHDLARLVEVEVELPAPAAGLAHEAGEPLFDVCDAHSQEMLEVYAALFDPEDDDLSQAVRDQFDAFDSDILVLDYVLLSPRWRGLKLGLLAARKMIDLLGGGCGLVVSRFVPLNPDAGEFSKVPAGWIPRHGSVDEVRAARRKLRLHFRRMGFERIRGTRFHGLSMSRVVPTLEDLLRPGR